MLFHVTGWSFIKFKLKLLNQGSGAPTVWPVENSGTTYSFRGFSLLSLCFLIKVGVYSLQWEGRGQGGLCTPRPRPKGVKTHPTVLNMGASYCLLITLPKVDLKQVMEKTHKDSWQLVNERISKLHKTSFLRWVTFFPIFCKCRRGLSWTSFC